ncbi:MAG: formyltransferase family protein [Longimicrobiales bacterium]|nr:formyltransferase family protein [Longimicrobiales bacterium]
MKVVFLCRDGLVARYVAHEVHAEHPLEAVVVESGRDARRRKMKRTLRKTPWWRMPLLAADLAALAVYGRRWKRELRGRLEGHPASHGYPEGVPRYDVDDANEPASVERLRSLESDVLLVLGTAILGSEVLGLPRDAALNIHGGIVPAYRNVHSEAWAVLNREPHEVGTSILHLDEGIDSGAVALQRRVEADDDPGLFELRWRNVELAAALAREALRLQSQGTLPREPQGDADAGFYPTPGARELWRLWRG